MTNEPPTQMEFVVNRRVYVKKNSRRMIQRGKKRFFVPSIQFTRFQELATSDLYDQAAAYLTQLPIFTGPVKIETYFDIPGNTRVDGDNLHTSILDVLEHAQIIDDDKNVIIGKYHKNMQSPEWAVTIIITGLS